MANFPSLSENPTLAEVYARFSESAHALFQQIDIVMRGDNPLSIGERELIAAYVSSLNSCSFCLGAHAEIAKGFGVEEAVIQALVTENFDDCIDDRDAALFRFIRKVNSNSSRITSKDVESLVQLGWSEEAIFSAVSICALFNQINRVVNSTGCKNSNPLKEIVGRKVESYEAAMKNAGVLNVAG